jgi:hypothetical protein
MVVVVENEVVVRTSKYTHRETGFLILALFDSLLCNLALINCLVTICLGRSDRSHCRVVHLRLSFELCGDWVT